MRSSYHPSDVIILLKDLTGLMKPLSTEEREWRIQSGVHYSEMLPMEYSPSARYLELYHEALDRHAETCACAVAEVSRKILAARGREVVLVSLARAGTPVGILIKRYLEQYFGLHVVHYTISIIRGRGIDYNAMQYILKRHAAQNLQFVDGWIGKGAITLELREALAFWPGVCPDLAVLADPAGFTELYGSSEDFLIPNACLNATVSGLFSRTILNDQLIHPGDFHGAVYYPELEEQDLSAQFLQHIQSRFRPPDSILQTRQCSAVGNADVECIMKDYGISNVNHIKPGIGETTRVLLRRLPWKILLRDPKDETCTGHIRRLCLEKNIEIVPYPLRAYKACGIIRDLSDL